MVSQGKRLSKWIGMGWELLEDWAYRHPDILEHNQERRLLLKDPAVRKEWTRGNLRIMGLYFGSIAILTVLMFSILRIT